MSINKKECEISGGLTAGGLLSNRGCQRAAIWVNGRQLLLAEYGTYVIKQGDEIKILRIAAGG
ncbi:MAG: hypothetical protein FWG42_12580 [Clostridiales bacterium]|nr:hypothetical protein [Clostridiales bacterium]